jgi:hypothetical protein
MKNNLAAYKRDIIDRLNSANDDLSPLKSVEYELTVSVKTKPEKVR